MEIVILLCIVDIVFSVVFINLIPHKIQRNAISIFIMAVGIFFSLVFLLLIALLGKKFGIFEETKSFILIALEIILFIDTIWKFIVRSKKG